ncbi:MAG TPA: CoA transferase [Solirubrobacteraceae bacterium]|jgi:crotonobetainyl-CoA:carnitine CoA-transferase CaiB-like acyl-CoA transferase
MTLGPLVGVVVLDFSRVLAGPLASMTLGDLGAEVLKVERPSQGDDTRAWGPPWRDGQSTYFLSVNRNKRSLVIDLASKEGLAQARQLAAGADVVVENFRPQTMERLGLGYEQLREGNERLIYCSISGFGRGPGAALPGYDLLLQAVGGLMSVTGEPDGPPTKVGVALVDVIAGLYATVGILAALQARQRTGRGQRVDVELLTSLLAGLVNQSSAHVAGGVTPGRVGSAHPSIAPYETLEAADGELVLAVGNDRQFGALCGVLGLGELASDSRFATNPQRVANRDQLRELLQRALAGRRAEEWVSLLLAAGVPSGVVNDLEGAFALAEGLGLEPVVELTRQDGSTVRSVRSPIGLSETPVAYTRPPPRLGEDDG